MNVLRVLCIHVYVVPGACERWCVRESGMAIVISVNLHTSIQQVQIYCNTKGLNVVGYYHANERLEDASLSDVAQCTANKITTNCEKACLLLVWSINTEGRGKNIMVLFVQLLL